MLKTVIRIPNHLGDAIMAQGAIRSFAERAPDSDIHLLMPEWAIPVYSEIPYLKYIPMESRYLHGFKAMIHQVNRLSRGKFGCGIVLTPSFSSALTLFLSRIKSRYGYGGEGRGILLNNKIPNSEVAGRHRSIRYYNLLERVAGHKLKINKPNLTYTQTDLTNANDLLVADGIDESKHYVVIAPQAVAESRRWGSANYGELAGEIIDQMGLQVVLIGTAEEYNAGQSIKKDNACVINLCGRTDIGKAGAIMSMASLFVGNDSGLAHLAAATGIPLVVLSGADNPLETSPLSDRKTVLIKNNLECISCVKNICPLSGDRFMQCMKMISVEEVFAEAKKLLLD